MQSEKLICMADNQITLCPQPLPTISLIQPLGLLWIRNSVGSSTRAVILPLCSTLVWQHLECCLNFWAPQFRMDIDGLQHVRRRISRLMRGLGHKSCEKWLRKLGMFILEKRRLRGNLITF